LTSDPDGFNVVSVRATESDQLSGGASNMSTDQPQVEGLPSGYVPVCDDCIDHLELPRGSAQMNGYGDCWECSDIAIDMTLVDLAHD
jgi:hypothetical protein